MEKRVKIFIYVIAIVIVIIVAIIFRRYILPDSIADKIDDMSNTNLTTEQKIYNAAIERLKRHFSDTQSALLANLMVAQSKVETANYTSNAYLQNNNAFGYKYYAGSIYQKGTGITSTEGNPYAVYNNVEDSAREVADWLGRRQSDFENVVTVNDYATALKANDYFGETAQAYATDVAYYYNQQPNNIA